MKKIILYNKKGEPYFVVNKTKHFLNDISTDGYDLTCFTNCGYFGGFKVINFEYDIDDFVILEEI